MAEIGFPAGYFSLHGSLAGNVIISLLQVRKPRLRKPEFTCLEIIQLVGDRDSSIQVR